MAKLTRLSRDVVMQICHASPMCLTARSRHETDLTAAICNQQSPARISCCIMHAIVCIRGTQSVHHLIAPLNHKAETQPHDDLRHQPNVAWPAACPSGSSTSCPAVLSSLAATSPAISGIHTAAVSGGKRKDLQQATHIDQI